jgi:hypothetical protein
VVFGSVALQLQQLPGAAFGGVWGAEYQPYNLSLGRVRPEGGCAL